MNCFTGNDMLGIFILTVGATAFAMSILASVINDYAWKRWLAKLGYAEYNPRTKEWGLIPLKELKKGRR